MEYISPEQNENFMNIDVTPAADFVNSSYVLIMQDSEHAPNFRDDKFAGSLELTQIPYVPPSRSAESK